VYRRSGPTYTEQRRGLRDPDGPNKHRELGSINRLASSCFPVRLLLMSLAPADDAVEWPTGLPRFPFGSGRYLEWGNCVGPGQLTSQPGGRRSWRHAPVPRWGVGWTPPP